MEQSFSEHGKQYWWAFIVGLLVLAGAGFAVYKYIDNRNNGRLAQSNLSRLDIVERFTQTPDTAQPTGLPKVSSNDLRGPGAPKPEVLGSSMNSSNPSPDPETAPPLKPYRNDALGFETMVPADAGITATSTQATARSGNTQGTYWTLEVYDHTSETLDSLINELSRSPSVTKLSKTTFGGQPALEFFSPNLQGGTGFALVNNGRLYYVIGNFPTSLLKNFKFF